MARLMSKVLDEEVRAGNLCAEGLSFSDNEIQGELPIHAKTARGNRLAFALEVHRAGLNHTHFLFDSLGMERAHCRVQRLRRPSLSWIHGIEVWEEACPERIRSARRTDWLVSNTLYTRDRAESCHRGFQRARVCWPATESDDLPPMTTTANRPPTALIVGRIDPPPFYKGHGALINCWAEVVSSVPSARLLIVGTGEGFVELRRKAAASPVSKNIELRGFVPESKLGEVWREANLLAMPSRGEGFGLVYIEAMNHGLPIIASIHDAAPEINIDGVTGYNVDLDGRDELTERLVQLLKDPDHAKTLGENGQRRWS